MAQSLEAKIVVLGSQGVGKTSLVHRYVKNHFQSATMTSTVGASFLTKRVIDDESDTVVRLQIWDTAGQERFRSISRLYYRGANACILCYSITDPISFTEMGIWLLELRRNLPPDIILHVVGTKSDLVARDPSLRQVPFERCIAYVADNLAPGVGSTPPVSAGGGGSGVGGGGGILERAFTFSAGNASGGAGSMGMGTGVGLDGARSPSSKRSSGFWGQEVGWDCCHEVSAESGEGVEEVFRVITRKLVEQNRILQEGIVSVVQSPGGIIPAENDGDNDGGSGYFSERSTPGRSGGSFRVGRDRRNWFGVPLDSVAAGGVGAVGSGGGDDGATVNVESIAVDHSRRRCC